MTAKPETAAEVLAEMRNSGWPYADNWADRLERALSAQGEAVAEVEPSNDRSALHYIMGQYDFEVHVCDVCGHEEPTKNYDTAIFLRQYLKTHPAPARVTEERVERVWMAATGRARLGKGYENDARCMTAEERADIRAALEADHG